MLIRMDRSSFAFANQLKSEKFNKNLTDARKDIQPIEKSRKELICQKLSLNERRSFFNQENRDNNTFRNETA